MTLSADVLFETGRWDLSSGAEDALTKEAKNFDDRAPGGKLFIIGHTDSRGTVEANQILSEKRAAAVAAWFIEWGFPEQNVTYEGAGESDPFKPDVDANGDYIENIGKMNRRVVIVWTP